jgi:hypothetical protein
VCRFHQWLENLEVNTKAFKHFLARLVTITKMLGILLGLALIKMLSFVPTISKPYFIKWKKLS